MRPHCRSRMCGQTACAQLNAPVRLTRRSRSQRSSRWSPNCPTWSSVPALLTRMSTPPSSSTTRATAASTSSRSVTSQRTANECRPSEPISSTVDSVCTIPCATAAWASGPYVSAALVSDSTRMSAITTSAPARASVSASARPRPREPPVTRATRPERSISTATGRSYARRRSVVPGDASATTGACERFRSPSAARDWCSGTSSQRPLAPEVWSSSQTASWGCTPPTPRRSSSQRAPASTTLRSSGSKTRSTSGGASCG